MDKKIILTQELKKWEGLFRLSQSPEYQTYLKPILESAFHNTWMNPAEQNTDGTPKFSTYEEFHKAYTEQYGRAIAYKELFNMLDGAGKVAENLSKQIKNPDKNYEL